jgi:two-component system, cell cycle response regulator DivK
MSTIPPDLLQNWKIVIVEDEPDSMDVASYILEFYGASIFPATDGGEGLSVIKSVRPDFVISDLSMPVMDGWELIHNLKLDLATREIPVIALTAHSMTGDRERAIGAGFHNYLTKPLTADTFIDQLVTLLLDIPTLSDRLNV